MGRHEQLLELLRRALVELLEVGHDLEQDGPELADDADRVCLAALPALRELGLLLGLAEDRGGDLL